MSRAIRTMVLMTFGFGAGVPCANAGDIDIGVTIAGEITPGVYGRVELGNRPAPRLVYAQPVIIEPAPVAVRVEPLYLHVPPGHVKQWRRHCQEYHACNRPVYFVWSREYEPGYVKEQGGKHEKHEHDHGRGHDHDRHDDDHEHGHGHDDDSGR